jgi:hypothetical protein
VPKKILNTELRLRSAHPAPDMALVERLFMRIARMGEG